MAQGEDRCCGLHLERETRARDQHRHEQVHHAAMKADVHVVERNHHATMRRRGGKSKSRMNRSLAEAGPAKTVQLLRHQCERHGKRLVEAPAPYNSRTCAACGSRETKLTRARIACAGCGHTADRDANAAANALQLGTKRTGLCRPRAAPTGRSQPGAGSSPAPQCPVPPESLGPEAALARREPSQAPGSGPKRRWISTRILSSCGSAAIPSIRTGFVLTHQECPFALFRNPTPILASVTAFRTAPPTPRTVRIDTRPR